MGFATEQQGERRGERAIRGCYRKAAVGCWFTATGRAIPQKLKFEDAEGVRHMVDHIQVLKTDRTRRSGIMVQRYECRAAVRGRYRDFVLLYHPGENTWDMIFPDELG